MTRGTNLDVSELDLESFLGFFFARPLLAAGQSFTEVFCSGYVSFRVAQPRRVVVHLEAMCTGFSDIGRRYELGRLNQGIWAMLGGGEFELQLTLWNDTVPLQERLSCVRSMRGPFLDFVAQHPAPVMENAFDMWWDLLLGSFWSDKGPHQDYRRLASSDKAILDAAFDTLDAVLNSDDNRCQQYALHGLGHLHHPRVADRVGRFIQAHAHELTPTDLAWLEQCRDGTVM